MCLLIKYIKSVLWRVAKCLSYVEEARCLKVKHNFTHLVARFVLRIFELCFCEYFLYFYKMLDWK